MRVRWRDIGRRTDVHPFEVTTSFSLLIQLPNVFDVRSTKPTDLAPITYVFLIKRGNLLYTLSFAIAPTVGQVCAARILLNIQDVVKISPTDAYERSAGNQNGRVSVLRQNPHNASFQMRRLSNRRPPPASQDVLSFDVDADDSESIIDLPPNKERSLGASLDGDEPASYDVFRRWDRPHD